MKEVSSGIFYLKGGTNVGIISDDGEAIVIDTGLDDDYGRKILKRLQERGLVLRAVINTHSHADHIGGNNFLQKRTSCKIYCPEEERFFVEFPEFEAFYLSSGSRPLKGLKNKFICAKPSNVDRGLSPGEEVKLGNKTLKIISLRGHSPGQIGVEVEGVLFCADSFFSEELLKKYKIPFFSDVKEAAESLKFLLNSKYSFYVPCHVQPAEDIQEVVEKNLRRIEEIKEKVEEECKGIWLEEIISKVISSLGASPRNISQLLLLRTAILSYVSWLEEEGSISLEVKGSRVICSKMP